MATLMCRLIARAPADSRVLPTAQRHVESCLRCQASRVRRRVVQRTMASMGIEVVPAPAHLGAAVLAGIAEEGEPHRSGRVPARLAAGYAAAAGVGAAAAAAVMTGMVRRRSRPVG